MDSLMSSNYISGLEILPDRIPRNSYTAGIPALNALEALEFNSRVTFFTGENGSGKSTLLEGIAVAYGFNPEGGTKNFMFSTRDTHSDYSAAIRLKKGVKKPQDGFFLRAESFYNVASQVVDKIGHLCDYILFDSAWVGYEQFIPMMADCSPLLLELTPDDPGIFVTQSVHKQQAGFSQTSQIHKKDNHLRGQARFCPHKRLNNAFMLHASTSPFYPLFAALDVNAKIHEGESGRRLWAECVALGIEARKAIIANCKMIQPFIPPVVAGRPWQDHPTEAIARERRFFSFEPDARWHGFEGYADDQYFVDPCKLLLTTPGIDAESGEYSEFGIPATILAHYLRENGIVPEKCDLNSILFLLTPAESAEKMAQLVAMLGQFEQHIEADTPLADVLPTIYNKYPVRYRDYTLRELCQEMHDLYVSFDVKSLQKEMFRKRSFPRVVMNPQDANHEFIRGNVELVRLSEAEGRVAAEGALPYPPGVLCVVPGEVWGGAVLRYFLALEEGVNMLPGFSPELQGVYSETDPDGIKRLYGYVLKG